MNGYKRLYLWLGELIGSEKWQDQPCPYWFRATQALAAAPGGELSRSAAESTPMSYSISALVPPDVTISDDVLEDRIRAIPGIGVVERLESPPPPSKLWLTVQFPEWEMLVGSEVGDTVREETEEIINLYGKGHLRLTRVFGSSKRICVSVPEPPANEEWFDFCWEVIEVIRSFADVPVFDNMQTDFVFD